MPSQFRRTRPPKTPKNAVEREIDELIDGAPPPDWDDPAAIAARREQLTDAACRAAELVVELLVHNRLTTARGMKPTADDAPVVAAARVIEALHRGLVRYRHDTRLLDGLERVTSAMAAEAGQSVSEVAVQLLRLLWRDLDERAKAAVSIP